MVGRSHKYTCALRSYLGRHMGGMSSRRKGAEAERQVARIIEQHLGSECRRGYQTRSGSDEPDVVGLPNHHVEVKRQEKVNIWAAMRQAEAASNDEDIQLVVTRKNREPWLAVLHLEDYLRLLKEVDGED